MTTHLPDYYAVLGVSPDASQEEIRKAFRKSVREAHPDINSESPAAEGFQRLKEAYEVLRDPDARRGYDRRYHERKRQDGAVAPLRSEVVQYEKQAPATPLLVARGLHKHYRLGDQDLHVLRGVDMSVQHGEWLAVLGASGSGKSTLLHLLGGLDRPDRGGVQFGGEDVFSLRGRRLDQYRNSRVGFVFQFYHLLPELTALENVLLSGMIHRSSFAWIGRRRAARERAVALLEQMGLGERLKHRPSKLSGGERQRVAVARALMNEPAVLLADEPTGNLDERTGTQLLEVFRDLHAQGQTIVMVTHDNQIAAAADRRLHLHEGRLSQGTA